MSERVVVCDFCSAPVSDSAWDFPARDVDYGEQRTGPGLDEPVEGSIGAWIACDVCGELILHGQRDELARRSADRFVREHREWVPRMGGMRGVLANIRHMHDVFWTAREGEGTPIGREQIELVARDPPMVREQRPGPRPR